MLQQVNDEPLVLLNLILGMRPGSGRAVKQSGAETERREGMQHSRQCMSSGHVEALQTVNRCSEVPDFTLQHLPVPSPEVPHLYKNSHHCVTTPNFLMFLVTASEHNHKPRSPASSANVH